MNNYYNPTLSQHNMQDQMASQQRSSQRRRPAGNMGMINTSGQGHVLSGPLSAGSDMGMSGAETIDDIVRQGHGMHRRGSVPQQYAGQTGQNSPDRPLSMMDFNHPNNNFPNFQFGMMHGADMTGGFDGMGNDLGMPTHTSSYGQPSLMSLGDQNGFPVSMGFSNLNVGSLQGDHNGLDFLQSPTMGGPYHSGDLDAVNTDFTMEMGLDDDPTSASSANQIAGIPSKQDDSLMGGVDDTFDLEEPQTPLTHSGSNIDRMPDYNQTLFRPNLRATLPQNAAMIDTFQSPLGITQAPMPRIGPTSMVPATPMSPATSAPTPGAFGSQKSIYSKSGFDMLKALWHVAARPNPVIDIGAVDLSCAFVVCDMHMNDCPIIYVSENFQNLTGYNRHEILGKNCRFLQAPDGNVEAGTKREFVAADAVQNLKTALAEGKEIQQSLINYRKGGKPFLNLLTMIPIPWDTDDVRYFIGFQIDLVERPDAISGMEVGGLNINYTRSEMDRYVWSPPDASAWNPESGQTLGIDDVSTLLQSFNPKGSTSDWHRQSWDKMLLENSDDVIHVLTLKGVFLYVSPACKKVLQYEAHSLVGQNISAICHPSDLVAVQRDIKDAPQNGAVNFIYRVMRGKNGYTWFDAYGSLYSEQGKGRKCLIMVGRKRPVTVLRRSELEANGGLGDLELWSKVSTSGMFLFVSVSAQKLLEWDKASLIGTSMQDLMRKESRIEFGRTIEKARKGQIVTCKHELYHKRGTTLQASTTFYPGDTPTGTKPSFLIAQTKIFKASSRMLAPATARPTGPLGVPVLTPEGSVSAPLRPIATPRVSEDANASVQTVTDPDSKTDPHDLALADDDNLFEELRTTRGTSWYYELRNMEKVNRGLSEELAALTNNRKKRKRRKAGNMNGRISPRNSARGSGDAASKKSNSPSHSSPLHNEVLPVDNSTAEQGSKASTTPASTDDSIATPTPPPPPPPPAATATASNGAAPPKSIDEVVTGHAHSHGYNPPQSTPMLEGGSGLGGGGMEMTAIQEERETSA
ncbi:hypothetical protein OQA88_8786 [Cercophora sp. LCS_1]